jgi:hypothetical protein
MALQGFLQLEGEDLAAFAISALAGYAAGDYFSNSGWSVYLSILVSYHLFLGWLVLNQSGKAGLSMPLWLTAPTHAACMVVARGPAMFADHRSLGFGLFRYSIAALALFEAGWLFSNEDSKPLLQEADDAALAASGIRATAEDEAAWLSYLAHRRPGQTKSGTSVRDERDAWLRARMKEHAKLPPQPSRELQDASEAPAYQAS